MVCSVDKTERQEPLAVAGDGDVWETSLSGLYAGVCWGSCRCTTMGKIVRGTPVRTQRELWGWVER